MRCLYLCQELAPHFTEGGLGLTAATLPYRIDSCFDCEHTILLPHYPALVQAARVRTRKLAELPPVTIAGRTCSPAIEMMMDTSGPNRVLLLRADEWYLRKGGIYRDPNYVEYEDAALRASFYGASVRNWMETGAEKYDLVHANDWQSGMALLMISGIRRRQGSYLPRLLYNIHSGVYRGYLEQDQLTRLTLTPDELASLREHIGADGWSSMLAGMVAADALVTCSPNYALELRELLARTSMSAPLEKKGVTGILSGIDTHRWDPNSVEAPSARYTVADVTEGKTLNKLDLHRRCAFVPEPTALTLGICGRLVQEKGIDFVVPGLLKCLETDSCRLIVMGNAEPQYRELFRGLEQELPRSVRYWCGFDLTLARLLYAGCDATLMPSLTEPCGLNQMISMRYGTLPIVSLAGGLKDSVVDLRHDPENATGLTMGQVSAAELRNAVKYTANWFRTDPHGVYVTRQRMMSCDWSWDRSAALYHALYERLLSRDGARDI